MYVSWQKYNGLCVHIHIHIHVHAELSEEDEEDGASDSGSPSSLLQGVQSTMEQLSAFKKQVTGTTHS